MSHTNLSHRRTHNVLLISRLLNQREGASPFTLVLDNLEQPATPLLKEYIRRVNVCISFTPLFGGYFFTYTCLVSFRRLLSPRANPMSSSPRRIPFSFPSRLLMLHQASIISYRAGISHLNRSHRLWQLPCRPRTSDVY